LGADFYLFYFPTVSVGLIFYPSPGTIVLTGLVSASYLFVNLNQLSQVTGFVNRGACGIDLVFRPDGELHFGVFSPFGKRLLNLFNTLNRRTSELEKIHAQMEMVYENSRILAGILDFDQIVEEILKIGERVLDYPALGIMLLGPGDNLIYADV